MNKLLLRVPLFHIKTFRDEAITSGVPTIHNTLNNGFIPKFHTQAKHSLEIITLE